MSVPIDLIIRGFTLDIPNKAVTVSYTLSKFDTTLQTVTLANGADFTLANFQAVLAQVDSAFQRWIAHQ